MLMCDVVESLTASKDRKGDDEHSGEEKATEPYEEQIGLLSLVLAHYLTDSAL